MYIHIHIYIHNITVLKRGRLYRKWDINGRLTSQPALNKPRLTKLLTFDFVTFSQESQVCQVHI